MSNIEESNSAIALFLGAIEDYWEAEDRFEDTDEDSLYLNFEEVSDEYLPPLEDYSDWNVPVEELRYHESWDWLMPCIFKIIESKHTHKQIQHNLYTLISHNISATYQAVVETIKLINNE